jgi:hypothetical protein
LRIVATLAIFLLLSVTGWPATRTASKSAARKGKKARPKSAPSTEAPKSSGKAAQGKSPSRKRGAGKKGSKSAKPPQVTWRNRQTAPTPDRYREIQQALVNKGYSSEAATGTWGPQWAESLKQFQRSQNLEATGKLDSLSLIGLGLGPRREANAAATGVSSSNAPPGEHP